MPAAAAPRLLLEVETWADSLRPPVHVAADSTSLRRYPLEIPEQGKDGEASAQFVVRPPVVDGDLSDWRFVRWTEVLGAVPDRGSGSERAARSLRWALAWSAGGLYGAALVRDGRIGDRAAGYRDQESFILALAADSPYVQSTWLGPSRRFRVRSGGRVEAWTDLRGRRPEFFDAAAVGARAAARAIRSSGGNSTEYEIFLPWDAIFPFVPGCGDLGYNAFAEDRDGDDMRLAAVVGARSQAAWGRLRFGGDPPAGTWIVSQGALVPEGTCEWIVSSWRRPGPSSLLVRFVSAAGEEEHTLGLPSEAARVRVANWEEVGEPRSSARRVDVEWRHAGQVVHRSRVHRRPDRDLLARAARMSPGSDDPARFPETADVQVRLEKALHALDAMGTWAERRHHATGVLVWRRAAWAHMEALLEETEILQDVLAAPHDPRAHERLAARWPLRAPQGVPLGEVLLRGYRSDLDGSVQPYALFAPASLSGDAPAPAVVALHAHGDDERAWFEQTAIREHCEARGWIAVCPFGRGNTGYERAGERDVLDVLARTRAGLAVDGRRLHLLGAGMGGTGAWLVSLRHPRLFASATIVSGYGDLDQVDLFSLLGYAPEERPAFDSRNPVRLLRPDLDTAYRIVHGERDRVISVVNARVMHDALQRLGLAHEVHIDPAGEAGARFWDAELGPAFEHMAKHARTTDGVADTTWFATAGGPVAACFERGPWAIVYGTRGPGAAADRIAAEQLAQEWQARFLGAPRVVPDSSVSAGMLGRFDFLLVGTPPTNAFLERWQRVLPVRYEADGYVVGERFYPAYKFGVVYAAINPEFAGRSLVVASGMQDRIGSRKTLYRLGTDYIVVGPEGTPPVLGNFGAASWR